VTREIRRLLDRSFSGLGMVSIGLLAASLLVILAPMILKGLEAYLFRGTIEHRQLMHEQYGRGSSERLAADLDLAEAARRPVYEMVTAFEAWLDTQSFSARMEYRTSWSELEADLHQLLGPFPDEREPVLIRDQYGDTRIDQAHDTLFRILNVEQYDYSDPEAMGRLYYTPRIDEFRSTPIEPLFAYVEGNLQDVLQPRLTFYWRFLFDVSMDAHFFGGIWPELLGTFYLTLGALLFAVPMGLIAAIYLTEYAKQGTIISIIRTSINTLAGVPSIVFGLFGLAFFINTIQVSPSKSVLAGSLTLGLLVLPVVIRASEEAILAVPRAYKEAALSLGAGKWWTVLTVVLPAALPGILTGIVISMGRAAGETAPIIFTAAVSVGLPLSITETLTNPTPALPWNIYNLATEHESVDLIRHVQFGMVLALVGLVLALNLAAIILRARIAKKLNG